MEFIPKSQTASNIGSIREGDIVIRNQDLWEEEEEVSERKGTGRKKKKKKKKKNLETLRGKLGIVEMFDHMSLLNLGERGRGIRSVTKIQLR